MTATETDLAAALAADPDFLDKLADRLQARPQRHFNMAGLDISALAAPIGRVQVSPGQTISSASWGNPVWDQSINCFATTADRDSQWPTPHDGSECYTADTGSPWVYRSGAWHGRPKGYIANASGPPTQTDCGAAMTTLVSLAVPVVLGRRYRLTAYATGTQQTTTGGPRAQLLDDQGAATWIFLGNNATGTGQTVTGAGVALYIPTTSKTATLLVQAQAVTGGVNRVAINGATLLVEDIGSN